MSKPGFDAQVLPVGAEHTGLLLVKKPLINSTVLANYGVMRCSKCSHMSEYAVLSALL